MRHATIRMETERIRVDVEVELRQCHSVFPHLTVDLEPVGEYAELSISMMGYEKVGRGWRETVGGQGRDYVLEHFGTDPMVQKLCALWERWHLNGMRAGTREQNKVLADNAAVIERLSRTSGMDHYTVASALLESLDLNPSDGYKYGSAWLVEPLPEMLAVGVVLIVKQLGAELREVA